MTDDRPIDSVREQVRQRLLSAGLIGEDKYGPVPVARTVELEKTGFEAVVLETAAVGTLIDLVLLLAEQVDELRAELGR